MNDINWRILDDEGESLLKKNPDNLVLVETDITYRVDYAKYIENGRLRTSLENVIRFAFLKPFGE